MASDLGISRVYLAQLAERRRGVLPSTDLSVRIEAHTGGAVMRWDLRPFDWWLQWPELMGHHGAPTARGDAGLALAV